MAVVILDSDDNLKVLVPTLNLKLGAGVLRGSSKKNEPYKSSYVSATNLSLVTDACAPLLCPRSVIVPVVGI